MKLGLWFHSCEKDTFREKYSARQISAANPNYSAIQLDAIKQFDKVTVLYKNCEYLSSTQGKICYVGYFLAIVSLNHNSRTAIVCNKWTGQFKHCQEKKELNF